MAGYVPVYPPAFSPPQRWSSLDAMLKELMDMAGLSAMYRPVASPYFEPARRWDDVDFMLGVLFTALNGTTPVPTQPAYVLDFSTAAGPSQAFLAALPV